MYAGDNFYGNGMTGDHSGNGTGYADWMKEVDAACYAKAGVSVHDLSDCAFADWYDDGVSAKSAASKALKANGF